MERELGHEDWTVHTQNVKALQAGREGEYVMGCEVCVLFLWVSQMSRKDLCVHTEPGDDGLVISDMGKRGGMDQLFFVWFGLVL
jgi:hypothetical protein